MLPSFNYKNHGRLWRVYGRSVLRYNSPKKLWNAIRTEYAYRRRQSDVNTPPYLLNIEPLYSCNLECPLCDRQVFSDARRNDAGRLSFDLIDKIFDEIGDYLYQCQIFGQGEPMLDWTRTKYIIERAHHQRIFTLMSTNCTVMTPRLAHELVGSGLDYLVCAIDGISQESYEQYRVGGRVEKALATLELLCRERSEQKSPIYIEWQFLVHSGNIHEMDEARRIADKLGVFIRFSPLRGMEYDADLQARWLPDSPKWRAGALAQGETCYNWPCYFLWRSLIVNSNGQLARCLIFQNVAQYGSLANHSVMDLYNGPSSQRARQLFSKGKVDGGDFPSPCKNCSFYKREHGGPNLNKSDSLDPDHSLYKSAIPLKVILDYPNTPPANARPGGGCAA